MGIHWEKITDRSTREERWVVAGPISEMTPGSTVTVTSSKGEREVILGMMVGARRKAGDAETIVQYLPN